PDLMDRSMLVELPTILPAKRQKEAVLWAEYDAARPALLGALCTAVAAALRDHERTEIPALPRMADFATWVTAAEPGLKWETGRFLTAYGKNQSAAHTRPLNASGAPARLNK